MQFKFIGNPHSIDNRGSLTAFGIHFPLNIAVDVTDAHAIKKLMGNHHFAAVDGGKTYHQAPKLIASPALVAPDGTTLPASAPAEEQVSGFSKDEMVALAESVGIKVDKRWSPQTIAAKIQALATPEPAPTEPESENTDV